MRFFSMIGASHDNSGPMSSALANFEKMLAAGRDGALLRYGLGNEYLKAGDAARAAEHLRRATALDPNHSAAWKLLGRALADCGAVADAQEAYRRGIAVAQARGDQQAAREMTVFLRRLEKGSPAPGGDT
jgi:predicted Zn-dependent protease